MKTYTLYSNQDRLPLSLAATTPEGQIRGIFQISHGMAENKERYLPLMEYLSRQGYACIIHDHRGHGGSVRSGNDLGYLYEGKDKAIVEDLHQVTLYAKNLWPDKPLILMGHSMGSLVVRCYLQTYAHELAGLIVCGSPSQNPAAGIALKLADIQAAIFGDHHRSKLITALAFGPYERRFPAEHERNCWISANKENVAAYNASELCGFIFTVNGYHTLFSLLQRTYSKKEWDKARACGALTNLKLPIYFIAGEEDPCINTPKDWHNAIQFLKDQGFTQVSQTLYAGMRHEIHNEIGKEKVWADILAFSDRIVG